MIPVDEAKDKSSITHTDIDRWLKSVDGLAKDLQTLKALKKKSQDKMTQIGKKYQPEPQVDKTQLDKEEKPKAIAGKPEAVPSIEKRKPQNEPQPKPVKPTKPVKPAEDEEE